MSLNVAEVEYIQNHPEKEAVEIAELLNTTVATVKKLQKKVSKSSRLNKKDEFHPNAEKNPGFGNRSGATVLGPGASQRMDDLRGASFTKGE